MDDPSELSVLIGSFNTHKRHPPADTDLSSWLIRSPSRPYIVAVGLQELAFSQEKSAQGWAKLIEQTLPEYQLLSRVRLAGRCLAIPIAFFTIVATGLLLLIYVHSSHADQCSSIGSGQVPTGFLNLYGNKGAVGIRFEFHRQSLCFLNNHLAAGEDSSAFARRNEQYARIHQKMQFRPLGQQHRWTINEHDGIFFFGDLNYRTRTDERDELKDHTDILQTYSEAPLRFPATYKYYLNTDRYNLSRRPSWTDRILYRSKHDHIRSIDYWSPSMIRFSDHRPIAKLLSLSRLIRR